MSPLLLNKEAYCPTDIFASQRSMDKLLLQKALLRLRYEDLQNHIMECGFSPIMVSLAREEIENNPLSHARLHYNSLHFSTYIRAIDSPEDLQDTMDVCEIYIKDTLHFLTEDYLQIGYEIQTHKYKSFVAFEKRITNHIIFLERFEQNIQQIKIWINDA